MFYTNLEHSKNVICWNLKINKVIKIFFLNSTTLYGNDNYECNSKDSRVQDNVIESH